MSLLFIEQVGKSQSMRFGEISKNWFWEEV